MAYMVMLVLEDNKQLRPVLEAWQALDVDDITFVESTCAHLCEAPRVHIPVRFMFEPLSGKAESCTLTLFAIVPDEATVHACTAAAEDIIGDLDAAPTAILAAWPLPIVKGLNNSGLKSSVASQAQGENV